MKHTDHTRQFLVWLDALIKDVKRDPRRRNLKRGEVTEVMSQATKFLLPGNGILLDDPLLKGIDDTMRLSLPFPTIGIEFPEPWGALQKTIITLEQQEAEIVMYVTIFHSETQKWGTMSPLRINRDHYIERNDKGEPDVLYSFDPLSPDEMLSAHELYHPYLVVFLQFMNAMACKNVKAEHSPVSKTRRAMQKGPIPYDEYKVLTTFVTPRDQKTPKEKGVPCKNYESATGITHASPREHLRRGHIVRMSNGTVYWRNATIVMAGNGGKIEKAYAIK